MLFLTTNHSHCWPTVYVFYSQMGHIRCLKRPNYSSSPSLDRDSRGGGTIHTSPRQRCLSSSNAGECRDIEKNFPIMLNCNIVYYKSKMSSDLSLKKTNTLLIINNGFRMILECWIPHVMLANCRKDPWTWNPLPYLESINCSSIQAYVLAAPLRYLSIFCWHLHNL